MHTINHSCSDIQSKIQLLIDGELDRHTAASMHKIIQECPLCAQKYASAKSLKDAVVSTVNYRITPDDLNARIMSRIKDINTNRR